MNCDHRFPLGLGLLVLATYFAEVCALAAADDDASTHPIRIALYADAGASQKDSPQLSRCLPVDMGFNVEKITAADIQNSELQNFDVLIHPGGSGSKQAETLGENGRERVRQFVREGGGFVGICAGAYLASANYPWSLNLLDAQVLDTEHWARGYGDVQLRLPPAGRSAFQEDDELITAYYHQGPLLAPAEKKDIVDYELLAAFETEIAKNGAPEGIMKGTTAIARAPYGKGRVICFSPHLEKTPGRDAFIRIAVQWAAENDTMNEAATVATPE